MSAMPLNYEADPRHTVGDRPEPSKDRRVAAASTASAVNPSMRHNGVNQEIGE